MWNLCSGKTWAKPSAFSIRLRERRRLVTLGIAKAAGIEDIRAHPEFLRGFLGNGQRIAGDHLDADAHLPGSRDRCLGIVARRIEQRQHTEKLPLSVTLGPRHAQ